MILKTTGQCTGAVVKVPESLCQFVEDSATRVRLSRYSSGTCRSLFSKFVGGVRSRRNLPHALLVTASNGLSLDRAQDHVVNTQLGLGRSVFEKL